MNCTVCQGGNLKVVKCPLLKEKEICVNCCFGVSTGKAEHIKYFKASYGWQKEDILVICEKCLRKV